LDALSNAEMVRLMADTIVAGKSYVIGNHNMHSLYMWHREPKMREFFASADCVYIDGMALILLGRMVGLPLKRRHRASLLDFLPSFAAEAATNEWRIFSLGSKPGVGEKAAERLRQQFPGLQIRTHHGHFDAAKSSRENQAVLAEINAYAPHLLMVGMGMPRQELWILENRADLTANVITSTGATMDYIAGIKSPAPRWLGQLYLEWFYRLITEPARLSGRYLVEPWFVIGKMASQQLRNKWHAIAVASVASGVTK
jgi:N-acetylglucosaminyldiphosphoundecaprenol N-acetyl-beta-D-mannosaminyltransferase